MKEIPLTQGKVALVDDADYEWLIQLKWCLHSEGYAIANGGRTFMHRLITDAPKGICVDHRDRNRLNNSRSNLRLATRANNQHNRAGLGGKSQYKGVIWDKKASKKWRAQIKVNYKCIILGRFDNEIDAAYAYDAAARIYHGEFARTNFEGAPQWTNVNTAVDLSSLRVKVFIIVSSARRSGAERSAFAVSMSRTSTGDTWATLPTTWQLRPHSMNMSTTSASRG